MVIYELLTKQNNIKHICINVNNYMDLFSNEKISHLLDIITHRDIIQTGLYATFMGKKIWCSVGMPLNSIKISNKEEVSTKISSDWSPIISLNEGLDIIEKVLKLKAFW
jgi:hypothetical protein